MITNSISTSPSSVIKYVLIDNYESRYCSGTYAHAPDDFYVSYFNETAVGIEYVTTSIMRVFVSGGNYYASRVRLHDAYDVYSYYTKFSSNTEYFVFGMTAGSCTVSHHYEAL